MLDKLNAKIKEFFGDDAHRAVSVAPQDTASLELASVILIEPVTLPSPQGAPVIRVHLHGCPLHCKHCYSTEIHECDEPPARVTPTELAIMIAEQMGGEIPDGATIVMGGGEPALHADFIHDFKATAGTAVNIDIETTLNVHTRQIDKLIDVVRHWYVDIKTIDDIAYYSYTGRLMLRARHNLEFMTSKGNVNLNDITIIAPVIPGYVSQAMAAEARRHYAGLGFVNIEHPVYNSQQLPNYDDECETPTVAEDSIEWTAPQRRRNFFKSFPIAGVSYHVAPDSPLWNNIAEGQQLALVRHKANRHDHNAVAIALPQDYDGDAQRFDFNKIIGYIPRSANDTIAKMIDMGYESSLQAVISRYNPTGPVNDRLQVTIYLLSSNNDSDTPRWRAQWINRDTLKQLGNQFIEHGIAVMQWPAPSPVDNTLAAAGDLVVTVCPTGKATAIYLLRILAVADDCDLYVPHNDEPGDTPLLERTTRDDSTVRLALTNVMGPSLVANSTLNIAGSASTTDLDMSQPLDDEMIAGFKKLLHDSNPLTQN